MQVQVLSCVRRAGKAKETGKPYDFQIVGVLMSTKDGTDFAELMLDADAVTPEVGKRYEVEMSFYPDQQRKLRFKVVALRPVAVQKAA